MKRLKILILLSTCPFSITAGHSAEEESWFIKTWNELINSKPTLQFDESHETYARNTFTMSQQNSTNMTPYYVTMNSILPYHNPYALSVKHMNSFYPGNTDQTYELIPLNISNNLYSIHHIVPPQFYQPIAPFMPLSQQTQNPYMSTNAAGILFTKSHIQGQTTFHNVRPPKHFQYISKEDVAIMKKDKTYTNQLLELIYWGFIPNCFTLNDIKNNPHIKKVIQTSADHRLWNIIISLNAFSEFPGLAKTIEYYAYHGLATAQHTLGSMYYLARGVSKINHKKAIKYFQLASDQGFAASQTWLGSLYYHGTVIEKDYHKAAQLFALAANQETPNAKLDLGQCYQEGHGVEQSLDQALKFYLSANVEASLPKITVLLKPVHTSSQKDEFFSEKLFFQNIEKVLGFLISAYSPNIDLSSYPDSLQTKQKKLRSWIYNKLTKTVSPLLDNLKLVAPGFLLSCFKKKVNITIAKIDPEPCFISSLKTEHNNLNYISFGEENAIVSQKLFDAFKFVSDAHTKINTITANSIPTNSENEDALKLENKVKSLKTLLKEEKSDDKKIIYQNKLNTAECDLETRKLEIENLRQLQKALAALKKDIKRFEKMKNLFLDYIKNGAPNRNELFLHGYPYLRAK